MAKNDLLEQPVYFCLRAIASLFLWRKDVALFHEHPFHLARNLIFYEDYGWVGR